MQPAELASAIVDGLLFDLADRFPTLSKPMEGIESDLYGWKVARAEALADRLKKEMLLAPAARSIDAIAERLYDEALRDEFAKSAPKKVPNWFVHVPPPDHPGPAPTANVPSLDEESEEFRALPYEEQWAKRRAHSDAVNAAFEENQPRWDAWRQRRDRWEAADTIARFFQWRWYYADQMLRARNPEPHPVTVEVEDGELTEVEKFNSEPFVINARKVLTEISRPPHIGETPSSRFKDLQTLVNELFPF